MQGLDKTESPGRMLNGELFSTLGVPRLRGSGEKPPKDGTASRSFSVVKRWLREPLLHFLLIGVVLFGLYAYINRGRSGAESPRQIIVSLDELATMEAYFESQW